ncbi:TPA: hypothetical protein DIS61_04305 [Patescibacteria group bacterium]|nr:MAG: hypothetical protein A3A59_01270 [Candidatus Gottesmanbacteria bacterium RIFCSPLOWO2_01_FULL_42_10]HCM37846.1 hypothetical protein [Patescibacteria group bacterium]
MNKRLWLIGAGIFLLAFFLRTYHFADRINFETDNTRDALVADYAKDHHKWPLIGQVTSAGPFYYGPWWYWFLSIVGRLPLGYLTYWYVAIVLSMIFIIITMAVGWEIGGIKLAVLAGIFASVSQAQVGNALSIWNPSIIPLLSLTSLFFLVRWFKYGKTKDFIGIGFFWSLAMTIHFQTILTLPVLLVALVSRRPGVKQGLLFLLFLALPFIPLLIFDLKFDWYNSKSVYWYLTKGQYKIWVPNRWLTYAGEYWPKTWSYIIGGYQMIGGLLMSLISILTLMSLRQWKKHVLFLLVAIVFVLEVILFRSYRGERFVYYSFFAHGTVIILSAWVVQRVLSINKWIGAILFLMLVGGSLMQVGENMQQATIVSYTRVASVKNALYQGFPNQKFALYGCKHTGFLSAYALSYLIYRDGMNDGNGTKIGVCFEGDPIETRVLLTEELLVKDPVWYDKSALKVHKETLEWWIDSPPDYFPWLYD